MYYTLELQNIHTALPVKWAQTENSKATVHLEEPLKLNDWICSINRGFSPAGTEDWALLNAREEHMLRHSLPRPQMFLNSWFPQVAFPFSPRYCANYFSPRSTWVAPISDGANSTRLEGRWIYAQLCDTLVSEYYWLFWNAYESWWSIFLLLPFAAQIRFI